MREEDDGFSLEYWDERIDVHIGISNERGYGVVKIRRRENRAALPNLIPFC